MVNVYYGTVLKLDVEVFAGSRGWIQVYIVDFDNIKFKECYNTYLW